MSLSRKTSNWSYYRDSQNLCFLVLFLIWFGEWIVTTIFAKTSWIPVQSFVSWNYQAATVIVCMFVTHPWQMVELFMSQFFFFFHYTLGFNLCVLSENGEKNSKNRKPITICEQHVYFQCLVCMKKILATFSSMVFFRACCLYYQWVQAFRTCRKASSSVALHCLNG